MWSQRLIGTKSEEQSSLVHIKYVVPSVLRRVLQIKMAVVHHAWIRALPSKRRRCIPFHFLKKVNHAEEYSKFWMPCPNFLAFMMTISSFKVAFRDVMLHIHMYMPSSRAACFWGHWRDPLFDGDWVPLLFHFSRYRKISPMVDLPISMPSSWKQDI